MGLAKAWPQHMGKVLKDLDQMHVADRFFFEELVEIAGPEVSFKWLERQRQGQTSPNTLQARTALESLKIDSGGTHLSIPTNAACVHISHSRPAAYSESGNRDMDPIKMKGTRSCCETGASPKASLYRPQHNSLSAPDLFVTIRAGQDRQSTIKRNPSFSRLGLLFTDAAHTVLD